MTPKRKARHEENFSGHFRERDANYKSQNLPKNTKPTPIPKNKSLPPKIYSKHRPLEEKNCKKTKDAEPATEKQKEKRTALPSSKKGKKGRCDGTVAEV